MDDPFMDNSLNQTHRCSTTDFQKKIMYRIGICGESQHFPGKHFGRTLQKISIIIPSGELTVRYSPDFFSLKAQQLHIFSKKLQWRV